MFISSAPSLLHVLREAGRYTSQVEKKKQNYVSFCTFVIECFEQEDFININEFNEVRHKYERKISQKCLALEMGKDEGR